MSNEPFFILFLSLHFCINSSNSTERTRANYSVLKHAGIHTAQWSMTWLCSMIHHNENNEKIEFNIGNNGISATNDKTHLSSERSSYFTSFGLHELYKNLFFTSIFILNCSSNLIFFCDQRCFYNVCVSSLYFFKNMQLYAWKSCNTQMSTEILWSVHTTLFYSGSIFSFMFRSTL